MDNAIARRPTAEYIASRIVLLRREKVLLDADLARLYGVTTKRLNEQVKRNRLRFLPDFVFRLTKQDVANLRSQIATSSSADWGGRRYAPYVFTEHGALMAANVLNSSPAIEVSIYVVRAFVRLRAVIATHKELARKLDDLERKTQKLAALRQLMSGPEPTRRPIGFVIPSATKP